MSSLYSIQIQYLELIRDIEEQEGELTEGQNKLFEFTQESFANKAVEFCEIMRILDTDCISIDTEIARLTKLKEGKARASAKFEKVLLEALKMFGTKDKKKDIWRFEFKTFKLSTHRSESTEILKPDEVPNEYKKVAISDKLTMENFNKIKEIFPEIEGTTIFDKKAIKIHLQEEKEKTENSETIKEEGLKDNESKWAEIKTNYSLTLK